MTTGVVGHRPRVAVCAPQGELRWPKARPREPEARAFEASGFPPVIVGAWAGRKPLGTGRAEGHSLGGGAQGKLDWGKGEGQVKGNGILNQRTKSLLWIIWLLIGFDLVEFIFCGQIG